MLHKNIQFSSVQSRSRGILLMYKFIELVYRLGNNNDWDRIIPEIFLLSYKMYLSNYSHNSSPLSTGEKIGAREGRAYNILPSVPRQVCGDGRVKWSRKAEEVRWVM